MPNGIAFNALSGQFDLVTKPAGSDTQLQYNALGKFEADGDLYFDYSTKWLTVGGPISGFTNFGYGIGKYHANIGKDATDLLELDSASGALILANTYTQNTNRAGFLTYYVNLTSDFTVNGIGDFTGIIGNSAYANYAGSGVLLDGVYGYAGGAILTSGAIDPSSVGGIIGAQFYNTLHGGSTPRAIELDCLGLIQDGGTVTDHISLRIADNIETPTNRYGIYINDITVGGTLNYAIYTNAGLVRFGDSVSIAAGKTLTVGSLTATRIPFAGVGGLLTDDADLTFVTDTLTATKVVAPTSVSTPLIITAGAALNVTPAAGFSAQINLSTTGDFIVNTTQLVVDTSAAMVGIGTSAPVRLLHMSVDDANNATVTWMARYTHTTSGTAAAGIAAGIEFEIETAPGNNEIGAAIVATVTDVSTAAEDFALSVRTMQNGAAMQDVAQFTSNAQLLIGKSVSSTPKYVGNNLGWIECQGGIAVLPAAPGGSPPLANVLVIDAAASMFFEIRTAKNTAGGTVTVSRARGSIASPTTVADNDILGQYNAHGFDGTTSNSVAAAIIFNVDGSVSTGVVPGEIVFTTTVSGSQTARMIIRNDGMVGIGTITPDRLLHIEVDDGTTNGVTYPFRATHTTTGTPANGIGTGIEFETETGSGNNEIGATIEAITTDVTSTSEDFDLVFKLMAAGAAVAEVARFTSTGVAVFANEMRARGDTSGESGATTVTNGENTGTARSTGVGTIKFADATDRDNAGFIKIYIGTTAYYVPVFVAN